MIIKMIKPIVVSTYDRGDLHIRDVKATELQQALETDTYLWKQLRGSCSTV